jgi:hypothetical protein
MVVERADSMEEEEDLLLSRHITKRENGIKIQTSMESHRGCFVTLCTSCFAAVLTVIF